MLSMPNPADYLPPAMQAHLMGPVDYDDAERLQQRLVYEAGGRTDGRIHVLICEHRPIITVGRSGSHAHVRLAADELTSRQLEVRWVNRGGGCLIHGPGQIAVYPIVPLADRGWTVGEYLDRLQRGMLGTLAELGVAGEIKPGRHGVWGRGGLVAALGVAVKNWVAYHGAFVNVCPEMELYRHVDTDPYTGRSMSSLVAGRRQPIKTTTVRSVLIRQLAEALSCDRYHLHTGHPLLEQVKRTAATPAEGRSARAC